MARGKFEYWRTKDGLLQIAAWARDGLIDEQIAHNMGIRRSTLSEWKKRFSDIADALKKNKNIVDIEVENALYKRAVGYEYTEKTIEIDDDGKEYFRKKMPITHEECLELFKKRDCMIHPTVMFRRSYFEKAGQSVSF